MAGIGDSTIRGRGWSDSDRPAECPVCMQIVDPERVKETAMLAALVGHAAYAICIRCGQEVPDREDPDYLLQVRRHVGAIES